MHKFNYSGFLVYVVYPLCLLMAIVFFVRFLQGRDEPAGEITPLIQIGRQLQDFSYVDHKGNTGTLYAIDSKYTVIVFYKPASEACLKAIRAMGESTVMQAAYHNGLIEILALCPQAYASMAEVIDEHIPEGWINAFDNRQEAYKQAMLHQEAMPLFILLDSNKSILLKDSDYSELELWIREKT